MPNFDSYLDGVKIEIEVDWETIKLERLANLLQTDKYMITDYPITDEQREELKVYRQVLRDLTITYETSTEAANNYPEMPRFATL
tara:strand:- start:387 stop:641 length:255 start_codon:yes stop_codon:yes gene_type:complete